MRKDLIQCFFTTAERVFRFLENDHDFHFLCGTLNHTNNYKIIKPYRGTDESISVITRFEKDGHALELIYDTEFFIIDRFIYFSPFERFGLMELLEAAKIDTTSIDNKTKYFHDQNSIEHMLSTTAEVLKSNSKIVLRRDDLLMKRAAIMREARLEQIIRNKYAETIEHICTMAAKAFLEKNYKSVVMLLMPYQADLPKSELKKLELAKAQLRKSE